MTQTTLMIVGIVVACAAAVRGTWSPCGLSMISAINPMSERSRGHRYGLTCGWFIVGALVGGALLGSVMAALAVVVSLLPAGAWTAALTALVAVVCLASNQEVGVRLPTIPRQVNERWLSTYRRWVYAAGFGVQIGLGFATYVMTAANYFLVAIAALSGQPLLAAGLGLFFGLVRGLAVLLTARVHSSGRLMDLHRSLESYAAASLRTVGLLQGAAAVVLGAVAGFTVAGLAGAAIGCALAVLAVTAVLLSARPQRAKADALTCDAPTTSTSTSTAPISAMPKPAALSTQT